MSLYTKWIECCTTWSERASVFERVYVAAHYMKWVRFCVWACVCRCTLNEVSAALHEVSVLLCLSMCMSLHTTWSECCTTWSECTLHEVSAHYMKWVHTTWSECASVFKRVYVCMICVHARVCWLHHATWARAWLIAIKRAWVKWSALHKVISFQCYRQSFRVL